MSDTNSNYYEFWQETILRIQETLPGQEYSTWFNRIVYVGSEDKKVILAGASQFILDTVIARYRDLLVNTLCELTGEEIGVDFIVKSLSEIQEHMKGTPSSMIEPPKETKASQPQPMQKQKASQETTMKIKKESNLNYSYQFSNFVIGDNSTFA